MADSYPAMTPIQLARTLGSATASVAPAPETRRPAPSGEPQPLVIGHRGAAGYLPDHTLAGYALAIAQGADYIEPDLVATQDGRLIARHEPNIAATTDVASHPRFAGRLTTRSVDGLEEEGWFASDFTLAEIKTMRAVQPHPERPQGSNGLYEIPTLEEILELARSGGDARGRPVGVYAESKHPTYHADLRLPLEIPLVAALRRAGLDHAAAPVFIQSFEQGHLKRLQRMTPVRLVQLVGACGVDDNGDVRCLPPFDRPYDWTASGREELLARTFEYFTSDAGLEEVAGYAAALGPWKAYIQSSAPSDADGDRDASDARRKLLPPTTLVDRAHAAGLKVHAWTFRDDLHGLTREDDGDPLREYARYFRIGVDGVFSDFPDTAVAARDAFLGG
jgi:glycerophosphoryl diester phosphodiesterase